MPAPEHRDGADLLHVVAGRGAPAAQDARLAVEHEEGLGRVGLEVVERGEARLREIVVRDGGADLAEAIPPLPVGQHRAGQVEDGGADARGLGVRGADDHSLAGGQMAGGGCAAHALHVDETGPAGAERRAVGILAELRQRDAEAVDRIEHGGAGVELDRPIVDDQLHGGLIIKDKPAPGNRVSGVPDARRYNTPHTGGHHHDQDRSLAARRSARSDGSARQGSRPCSAPGPRPALAQGNLASLGPEEGVDATVKRLFGGRPIKDGASVIKLDLPLIAENGAVVPVAVEVTSPQTPQSYVKSIYIIADKNRRPLNAKFNLTPATGLPMSGPTCASARAPTCARSPR